MSHPHDRPSPLDRLKEDFFRYRNIGSDPDEHTDNSAKLAWHISSPEQTPRNDRQKRTPEPEPRTRYGDASAEDTADRHVAVTGHTSPYFRNAPPYDETFARFAPELPSYGLWLRDGLDQQLIEGPINTVAGERKYLENLRATNYGDSEMQWIARMELFYRNSRNACMEGLRPRGDIPNPPYLSDSSPPLTEWHGFSEDNWREICPHFAASPSHPDAYAQQIRPCEFGRGCANFGYKAEGVEFRPEESLVNRHEPIRIDRMDTRIGSERLWGGVALFPPPFNRPLNRLDVINRMYMVCEHHQNANREFFQQDEILARIRFGTCAHHCRKYLKRFPQGVNTCTCEPALNRWLCRFDYRETLSLILEAFMWRLTRPDWWGGVAGPSQDSQSDIRRFSKPLDDTVTYAGRGQIEYMQYDFLNSDLRDSRNRNFREHVYALHPCSLGCGRPREDQDMVQDCRSCGGLIVKPIRGNHKTKSKGTQKGAPGNPNSQLEYYPQPPHRGSEWKLPSPPSGTPFIPPSKERNNPAGGLVETVEFGGPIPFINWLFRRPMRKFPPGVIEISRSELMLLHGPEAIDREESWLRRAGHLDLHLTFLPQDGQPPIRPRIRTFEPISQSSDSSENHEGPEIIALDSTETYYNGTYTQIFSKIEDLESSSQTRPSSSDLPTVSSISVIVELPEPILRRDGTSRSASRVDLNLRISASVHLPDEMEPHKPQDPKDEGDSGLHLGDDADASTPSSLTTDNVARLDAETLGNALRLRLYPRIPRMGSLPSIESLSDTDETMSSSNQSISIHSSTWTESIDISVPRFDDKMLENVRRLRHYPRIPRMGSLPSIESLSDTDETMSSSNRSISIHLDSCTDSPDFSWSPGFSDSDSSESSHSSDLSGSSDLASEDDGR